MGRLARKTAPTAHANPVQQNVQAVSAQMSAFLASTAPVSVVSGCLSSPFPAKATAVPRLQVLEVGSLVHQLL